MLHRPLISPKRSGGRRESNLYYYYAGFAQEFIEQKLLEIDLPQNSVVLDPWCGSGTTLAAANRLGHHSVGCDINPVSVVLTRSRFASAADIDFVIRSLRKALNSLGQISRSERRPESLLWTFRNKIFKEDNFALSDHELIDSRGALLWTALFFFARQATRVTKSKNPSWRKHQLTARISLTEMRDSFKRLEPLLEQVRLLAPVSDGGRLNHEVRLLNNEVESISPTPCADAVITSPPYLTRLDYGVSTGLEWRLLNGTPQADLTEWRTRFTGSVLTARSISSRYPLPRSVGDILRTIQRHPSKAAETYYFQFFRNYFVGIQNSLANISSACRDGAWGLFIIQDSQFKDLNIPLTTLFSDMLIYQGWCIEKVEPFAISPTFYKINSRRWAAEDFVRSENVIWARRRG